MERVPPEVTYELRHRVLGRGASPADVAAVDDADPESGHVAHLVDGAVVGTGTIRRRPLPGDGVPGWQIRGMAVEARHRGKGIGSSVLTALLEHADEHGGGPVWCHARIAAVSLYERHGFESVGERFDDPVAGPQVLMVRRGPIGASGVG